MNVLAWGLVEHDMSVLDRNNKKLNFVIGLLRNTLVGYYQSLLDRIEVNPKIPGEEFRGFLIIFSSVGQSICGIWKMTEAIIYYSQS